MHSNRGTFIVWTHFIRMKGNKKKTQTMKSNPKRNTICSVPLLFAVHIEHYTHRTDAWQNNHWKCIICQCTEYWQKCNWIHSILKNKKKLWVFCDYFVDQSAYNKRISLMGISWVCGTCAWYKTPKAIDIDNFDALYWWNLSEETWNSY